MPRSIWRGVLSFGMVAIPVRLYLATESSSKVSFNLLCPEHQSRIKNKRWCPEGDHEVAWNDVVRAYEYEKGNYVELGDEDLEKLPLRSSKAIDISAFVEKEEIPGELYFQSAYYLEPEKAAQKPYALLKKTLDKTNRVAIAKHATRGKQYIVMVRPHGEGLLLEQLYYADEIRSFDEVPLEEGEVNSAELALAIQLIDQAAANAFDPKQFHDEVREKTLQG